MLIAHTARLALEPLGHAHADGLLAALDEPSVGRYIGGPDVTTIEALHERIAFWHRAAPPDQVWLHFAVRRREDGAIVGRLEATRHDDWAELAYLIGPAYQRRGYASEATAWMIDQLVAAGVRELWATIHPDNTGSRGVLARLGFAPCTQWSRPLGSYDPGDAVFLRARY